MRLAPSVIYPTRLLYANKESEIHLIEDILALCVLIALGIIDNLYEEL